MRGSANAAKIVPPSPAAAAPISVAGISGHPSAGLVCSDGYPWAYPLVAFLITEGTEDALHRSYLESLVELDRAGGDTLLFVDIGNPNVKGPTMERLVEDGVLRLDPSEVAQYEQAVAAAGGVMPYRRLEIARLREFLNLEDEATPLLSLVSTARPSDYALLEIPCGLVRSPEGLALLWKSVVGSLSEDLLRGICTADVWDGTAMAGLQGHLDRMSDQLSERESPVTGAAFIENRKTKIWTVEYGGERATLRHRVGLPYVRRLLESPGERIAAEDLWHERSSGNLPSPAVQDRDVARDLEGGIPSGLEVTDFKTIAAAREEFGDLDIHREEALKNGDFDRAEKLQQEINELGKEMGCQAGYNTRPRMVGGERQRRRDSATREVKRAIAAISKAHPAAATHLTASIEYQPDLCYRPNPPVAWTT